MFLIFIALLGLALFAVMDASMTFEYQTHIPQTAPSVVMSVLLQQEQNAEMACPISPSRPTSTPGFCPDGPLTFPPPSGPSKIPGLALGSAVYQTRVFSWASYANVSENAQIVAGMVPNTAQTVLGSYSLATETVTEQYPLTLSNGDIIPPISYAIPAEYGVPDQAIVISWRR